MKLVHLNDELNKEAAQIKEPSEFAVRMANKRFKRTCEKYAGRIKAIQQHYPEWEPKLIINQHL